MLGHTRRHRTEVREFSQKKFKSNDSEGSIKTI